MFRKISQVDDYKTNLTVSDFNSDPQKIKKEIENIEKKYNPDQRLATNITFDNKKTNLDEFLLSLKQKDLELKQQLDVKKEYDSSLFYNIGGKNVNVSSDEGRDGIKRQLAALEKQIQIREESLAEIDNYVVTLLSGEMANISFAHTNAKFIKIAEDMHKESDEEIEDYYNDLYEDSKGSPGFGTALEHPEENKNKLTTDIKRHSKFVIK